MANILDKHKLGSLYVVGEDSLAKAKEENKDRAAAYKIPDQELLENEAMAEGRAMDWTELVRHISKMNPNILIEKGGYPNALAVRWVTKGEDGKLEKRYVSGFKMEKLPEFSSVIVDGNDLPVKELRGWRTVLLCLINAGALTKKQVDLTFGPATGQRAILWDRSLQAHHKN